MESCEIKFFMVCGSIGQDIQRSLDSDWCVQVCAGMNRSLDSVWCVVM